MAFDIKKPAVGALILRFALIGFGEWQDRVMKLKYTDVDYAVFSDAAEYVAKGESPYRRETYRYTPLLAYMLTPNVFVHPAFGKILFCIFDVIAGCLMYEILRLRHVPVRIATLSSLLWLYNPLPFIVSSRGNAEAVLATLVLLTMYFLMKKNVVAAAIVYGIAVHVKTYPIIYAPSIYLLLNDTHKPRTSEKNGSHRSSPLTSAANLQAALLPSQKCLVFAMISIAVLVTFTVSFYSLYGEEFIMETYWYHVIRKDLQHNFSVYFYPLKLAEQWGALASTVVGLSAFVPQAAAVLVFSFMYYKDLAFTWFVITATFVTFNKVCTSQYFLWYLCLLPLVTPQMRLTLRKTLLIIVTWHLAQAAWLLPAYYFEYEGKDVLIYVWLASVGFLLANVWCIRQLLVSTQLMPLFDGQAAILQVSPQWTLPDYLKGD